MNARIFFWSLTSALAGFLFGFDTVVISSAEKTIQALWGLSPAAAWRSYGLRVIRHRGGLDDWRIARGPFWPQGYAAFSASPDPPAKL